MECQSELKWGKAESFGPMKMLKKSHTNWPSQTGTCFTNISSGQKLAKILEEKWLDGWSHNLVEGVYMDKRRPRKFTAIMEQDKIHLLHKLKI